MTSRKRPSLHRHTGRATGAARRRVALEGRCTIGGREAQDVLVTDLNAEGCRMRVNAVGVTKSDPVELRLGDAAPIAGRLKWSKGGALGVSFETPLDSAVLDTLYLAGEPSNVIPLRT